MRRKRLFDVVVSALGLLLLSPLLTVIALLVKLDGPGPCLYKGLRAGKDGQLFFMYKFRTMLERPANPGPRITARDDPRVTPLGRVLRKTKLNELPQLINVLRGEMSLVGPRPEDPYYVRLFTPEQRRVLSARPGITSPASIIYRHEESMLSQATLEEVYLNVIMPDKLRMDLQYVKHQSFLVDLNIIFWTFLALLPRSGHLIPEASDILFRPIGPLFRSVPVDVDSSVSASSTS